ncbi:MAG: glycoside hydrolase family 2 protein [Armatimonadota bacterium]
MALFEYALDGGGWEVHGYYPGAWSPGDVRRTNKELGPYPAVVPGAVQADLLAAGAIANPYWEEQSRLSEWVAARQWEFSREFLVPEAMFGKRIFLAFDGLEPGGVILLNGEQIAEHAGQFAPLELEVTRQVNLETTNLLQVVLSPAPPRENQHGSAEGVLTPQTRFTAKWDFGACYPPVGIWQSVRLFSTGPDRLADVWVRPQLNLLENKATVAVVIKLLTENERACEVRTSVYLGEELYSTDHRPVARSRTAQEITHEHFLANPQLWWPNGYGKQHCYRLVTEIFDAGGELSDRRETRFGLRDLRFARNDGAPLGALPYMLLVNGASIFLKGWSMVPLDHLYGRANDGKADRLLRMAHDAGANTIRVWGGGIPGSDAFYARCDELGLLVWQDFLQTGSGAGSTPPAEVRYLAGWEILAPEIIRRRRNHPCLAVWCGGSELRGRDGKPATTREPALALLQRLVREHDPERHFLPSTPSGPQFTVPLEQPALTAREQHDIHLPPRYLGSERHYAYHNGLNPLLVGAGGCAGAANYSAMHLVAREERLWPPTNANTLWVHRGQRWVDFFMLDGLFGLLTDLQGYIQASQLMQAEGLRYLVEANRRRKWHCSGVLLWQLNEPWPNLVCTNVVDYFGQPKPAYYLAANAFRAEAITARYERLNWRPGERFTAELYVHNSLERARPLEADWSLYDLNGNSLAGWCKETFSHPSSVARVGQAEWIIPRDYTQPFLLRLQLHANGKPLHRNDYLFSSALPPIFAHLRHLPPAELELQAEETEGILTVTVTNTGRQVALGVTIFRPDGHWLYGIDNYRHLLPGETWTAHYARAPREGFYMGLDGRPERREVAVSAWNTLPIRLLYEVPVLALEEG